MAKRNVQRTLNDFLVKKSKFASEGNNQIPSCSHTDSVNPECDSDSILPTLPENEITGKEIHNLDIGCCFEQNKIDENLKFELLTSTWVPDENYKFPICKKRNLKFQLTWLKRFPWLSYTCKGEQGAVCKYCAVFAHEFSGKGSHQKLNSLVTKPFNNWKDAIEIFGQHSRNQYHKSNLIDADNFIATFKRSIPNIMVNLDSGRAKQIAENRKKLTPIIKTIILCGRQELALRGTSDSCQLTLEQFEPEHNDGNFRALLRMRLSCGDKDLIDHVKTQSLNATYISPVIQNNIIKICGKIIQNTIVQKINDAKSFSILVDETTDISRTEQLSLCVRYVDCNTSTSTQNDYVLREDFLQFVAVQSTTGKTLASVTLETLQSLGIDCTYLVGQGYDGAAAMSGNFKGVQALIREQYPAALYVHCSAHSLNLALAHSCNVQCVRNCIGTIKSVGNFIKNSAMRTEILKNKIKEHLPNTKWTKLTAMCETRWVENHDGLIRFCEIFKPIAETLEELEQGKDIETSSKALQLHRTIMTSEFIISMVTASTLFPLTLNLCKMLQTVNSDLSAAVDHVDIVISHVKNMRLNIDEIFGDIFKKSDKLLKSVDDQEFIKVPRIVNRQKNRTNIIAASPEQYFRIAVAIPFFDDFIEQLTQRFSNHKKTISSLHLLLPNNCVTQIVEVENFSLYHQFLNLDTLSAELQLWKQKWIQQYQQNSQHLPNNAIESLSQCHKSISPNIHILLKILATLPISTATPERSFSTLKRLKSYLRNSSGQDRLTGLALLSVHRNIQIDTEEVLNRFANEKDRVILL